MRGQEKNRMKMGQTDTQTDTQTHRQTIRLLDQLGPEGRFGENLGGEKENREEGRMETFVCNIE